MEYVHFYYYINKINLQGNYIYICTWIILFDHKINISFQEFLGNANLELILLLQFNTIFMMLKFPISLFNL